MSAMPRISDITRTLGDVRDVLTLNTDFSLRVLIHVGLCGDKLTTIKDIAQSFGISKAHLMKVVNDLSQNGISKQCAAVTAESG